MKRLFTSTLLAVATLFALSAFTPKEDVVSDPVKIEFSTVQVSPLLAFNAFDKVVVNNASIDAFTRSEVKSIKAEASSESAGTCTCSQWVWVPGWLYGGYYRRECMWQEGDILNLWHETNSQPSPSTCSH